MVLISTFLLNLLCSIVPCDPNFGSPETIDPGVRHGRDVIQSPIVQTKLGKVEGYITRSTEGRTIFTFEGIPYAEPPINQFRFRKAVRKKPWMATLRANKLGPFCLQIHAIKLFRVIGEEDCLYLNIYTPQVPLNAGMMYGSTKNSSENSGLPVIIWIHGGSFLFGSGGEYGPAMMLDEDVVLVTINYRLGILGFLSTGDENSPGNYGLHDQALAIEWVYENIENFGGNHNQILLMGQSAGGVSVHLHMMSNNILTRKYFQAAASLSGNAFDHWALKTPQAGRVLAIKMASKFGCPVRSMTALVKCLRQINPVFLVAEQLNIFDWFPFPVVLFSPTLEQNQLGAFVTRNARDAYEKNQVAKTPWITSVTAQEGHTALLFTEPLKRTQEIRTRWSQLAPLVLDYGRGFNDSVTSDLTQKITSFYFNKTIPAKASLELLSQIISDRYFNTGFHVGLQQHSKVSSAFGYLFAYKGRYGLEEGLGISPAHWGVGHAEDVFYFFNSSATFPGFRFEDREKQLSKIMINMFVSFAKTRKPFYHQREIWVPVEDVENIKILELNHTIRMTSEPFKYGTTFWKNLKI